MESSSSLPSNQQKSPEDISLLSNDELISKHKLSCDTLQIITTCMKTEIDNGIFDNMTNFSENFKDTFDTEQLYLKEINKRNLPLNKELKLKEEIYQKLVNDHKTLTEKFWKIVEIMSSNLIYDTHNEELIKIFKNLNKDCVLGFYEMNQDLIKFQLEYEEKFEKFTLPKISSNNGELTLNEKAEIQKKLNDILKYLMSEESQKIISDEASVLMYKTCIKCSEEIENIKTKKEEFSKSNPYFLNYIRC